VGHIKKAWPSVLFAYPLSDLLRRGWLQPRQKAPLRNRFVI
jgi:hypothetical protein